MVTGINEINWAELPNIEAVKKLPQHMLYNDSQIYTATDMLVLNPNLTPEEKTDALFWREFLRDFQGTLLVTGEKRSGKGIFMHMLAKKMNYYWGKLVITDTRPTPEFGFNVPFSFPMLIDQLERIDEVEKGIPHSRNIKGLTKNDFLDKDDYDEYREKSVEDRFEELVIRGLVKSDVKLKDYDRYRNEFIVIPNFIPRVENGKWLSSKGEVFLRNCVMLLDELGSKYLPKTKPTLSEAQTILDLLNIVGHLHSLVVGVGITLDDFNPRVMDKSYWEARCIALNNREQIYSENPDDIMVQVNISPIKYNPMKGTVTSSLRETEKLIINGSEPRSWLNNRRYIDLFVTDNAQSTIISPTMRKRWQ